MASKKDTETKATENTAEPLTPKEYFDLLKGKREKIDSGEIQSLLDNAIKMMNRYRITGQKAGAVKLYNFACLCEKELGVVKAGITTYVNRVDIDEYITKIADKAVCIIELENFERDLPDSIIDKVAQLKADNIFDEYYVVFSDYTGKERKKVEQKRRDKDPILFGALKIGEQLNSRLYYIDSWTDEFCDLTLDKLVSQFKADKNYGETPVKSIRETWKTEDEFKKAYDTYKKGDGKK
jgi:hypothetical protein